MTQHVKKLKQEKKRKEEKKFREEFTYGQTDLAVFFDVDRATIARWCRQGLPYVRSAHGHEHRIELRTAIHWYIGHHVANRRGLELSALEKILLGLARGDAAVNEYTTLFKWQKRMVKEVDWFDASPEKIFFAIGRLSGMKCLPFRHSW